MWIILPQFVTFLTVIQIRLITCQGIKQVETSRMSTPSVCPKIPVPPPIIVIGRNGKDSAIRYECWVWKSVSWNFKLFLRFLSHFFSYLPRANIVSSQVVTSSLEVIIFHTVDSSIQCVIIASLFLFENVHNILSIFLLFSTTIAILFLLKVMGI